MRRLYRRLALLYLVSALLFVLIFGVLLYLRGRKENEEYLSQLLESVDHNLEEATREYEETVERLGEEYVTHARETAYILENDPKAAEPSALEAFRELLGVGAVSLLGTDGKILVSTEEELVGTREEEQVMVGLLTSPGDKGTVVQVDEPDFWEQPAYFYVAVPVESPRFAAVRLDGDMEQLGLSSGAQRVQEVLRQATTEYDTSIFAAGKARGLVIGITENNRQDIQIRTLREGRELLDYLEGLPLGEVLAMEINGAYQSTVLKERHDMYLAAFTGMDRVASDVFATFGAGLSAMAVISGVTILMVRMFIRRYLLDHFRQVEEGIYEVLRSGRGSGAGDSQIPELKPLMETISRLEREYVDKSEGMIQMEDALLTARKEAQYDRLTGLYNRNGFERRVEEFLEQGDRQGMLILFDLDNFKRVNDGEGHPAGDRLLIRFARCLCGVFRREDVIGRLGGDEFAVLIQGPLSREMIEERFRIFFEELHAALGDSYEKYQVSASAGAVAVDGSLREYEELCRCADTALYIAKYLGKDRYYINEKKIACMRRECIGCRADCPRSQILKGKE